MAPDQIGIQDPLPPPLDVELALLAPHLESLLLAHQPPVLLLDVFGQEVLLLHDLDQPADGRGQKE